MNIETRPTYLDLMPGDPCPWLRHRRSANQLHCGLDDRLLPPGLDRMAGRHIVLCFYASAGELSVASRSMRCCDIDPNSMRNTHAFSWSASTRPTKQRRGSRTNFPACGFSGISMGCSADCAVHCRAGDRRLQLRALARRQAPDGSAPPEPSPRSSSICPLEYVQECPRRVEAMGEVRSRSLST